MNQNTSSCAWIAPVFFTRPALTSGLHRPRRLRATSKRIPSLRISCSDSEKCSASSRSRTMANLMMSSLRGMSHPLWSCSLISGMKTLTKSPFREPRLLCRSSCVMASRRLSHSAEPPTPPSLAQEQPKSTDDSLLVYSGSMSPMVKRLKLVSLTTSTVGISMQPFIYRSLVEPTTSSGVSIAVGAAAVTTTLVMLSPLLLNLLTKRYVTHLYFNEQSQTFTLISLNFFNRKKSRTFRADDVQVPLSTGPFTTFLVNGQPYFVDGLAFSDINIYNHLMGYDKLDEKIKRMTEKTSNDGASWYHFCIKANIKSTGKILNFTNCSACHVYIESRCTGNGNYLGHSPRRGEPKKSTREESI